MVPIFKIFIFYLVATDEIAKLENRFTTWSHEKNWRVYDILNTPSPPPLLKYTLLHIDTKIQMFISSCLFLWVFCYLRFLLHFTLLSLLKFTSMPSFVDQQHNIYHYFEQWHHGNTWAVDNMIIRWSDFSVNRHPHHTVTYEWWLNFSPSLFFLPQLY